MQLASRALVGVAAQSLAGVEDAVSISQFRVLIIIASRGPMALSTLAEAVGVHPSNATRACDRLVADGLLDRRDEPADRRHLRLTLTRAGRDLVNSVTARRRDAVEEILQRMAPGSHDELIRAFGAFAAAAGEPSELDLWSLGWTADETTSNTTGVGGPPADYGN